MTSVQSDRKLRMHKVLKRPWHKESGLVFKSSKERVVIGRMDGDEFVDLDDDTIELASNWEFKLDPSMVSTELPEDENTESEQVPAATEEDANEHMDTEPEHNASSENGDNTDDTSEEVPDGVVCQNGVCKLPETTMSSVDDAESMRFDMQSSMDRVFDYLSDLQKTNLELDSLVTTLRQENQDMLTKLNKAEKRVQVLKKSLLEME